MYDTQRTYADLRDAIRRAPAGMVREEALRPWLDGAGSERRWLADLRDRLDDPPVALEVETSCRLYALSRCLDALIRRLSAEPADTGPDAYVALLTGLGLDIVTPVAFHPFWCEIHRVIQAPDPDRPPTLRHVHWPTAMLGQLMIQRAGVTARAGRAHLHKARAEGGVLYWCSERNRPRADLSDGWGHNSQWGTRLREDHAMPDVLIYNLRNDPEVASPDPLSELSPRTRAELLRHRCFVTESPDGHDHPDLWPYDSSLTEPRHP
ncbi:hypothetical protein [Jannaschia marina]|uniref:hypothetical protein n=1 Tax=Jannaschia marina TaxID=2741674 RepID=UPI0015CA56C9|nr:hypothetical protein [Jannaschia marina]